MIKDLVVKIAVWIKVINLIQAVLADPKKYPPGLLLADVFAASKICLSVFSSISSTLLVSSTSKSRGEMVDEMVAAVEVIDAFVPVNDPVSTLLLATLVAVKGGPAAGKEVVSGAAAAGAGVGACCGGGGGGRFGACLEMDKN